MRTITLVRTGTRWALILGLTWSMRIALDIRSAFEQTGTGRTVSLVLLAVFVAVIVLPELKPPRWISMVELFIGLGAGLYWQTNRIIGGALEDMGSFDYQLLLVIIGGVAAAQLIAGARVTSEKALA